MASSSVHDKFYNFPPFFTLQPTPQSRKRQLEMWAALIKAHCAESKQFTLTRAEPIYSNADIQRSLSHDFITELFRFMVAHDHAFPNTRGGVAKSSSPLTSPQNHHHGSSKRRNSSSGGGTTLDSVIVLFHPRDRWYEKLYDYAKRAGLQNGGIATLFEILNDPEFEGMDEVAAEVLLRGMMRDTRKCEVIEGAGGAVDGVKFF